MRHPSEELGGWSVRSAWETVGSAHASAHPSFVLSTSYLGSGHSSGRRRTPSVHVASWGLSWGRRQARLAGGPSDFSAPAVKLIRPQLCCAGQACSLCSLHEPACEKPGAHEAGGVFTVLTWGHRVGQSRAWGPEATTAVIRQEKAPRGRDVSPQGLGELRVLRTPL